MSHWDWPQEPNTSGFVAPDQLLALLYIDASVLARNVDIRPQTPPAPCFFLPTHAGDWACEPGQPSFVVW